MKLASLPLQILIYPRFTSHRYHKLILTTYLMDGLFVDEFDIYLIETAIDGRVNDFSGFGRSSR